MRRPRATVPQFRPPQGRQTAGSGADHRLITRSSSGKRLTWIRASVSSSVLNWTAGSVAGALLIGGSNPTYIAGLIVLSLRIPIVTLANFGGAAQRAWDSLNRTRNEATDEELQAMADDWSDTSAATIVRIFKDQARRGAERAQSVRDSSKRATSSLVVAAILFVLGVTLIPLLFAIEPSASRNVAVLIAASLLVAPVGAVIRNVMGRGQHWLRTAVLGMVAGAIAGLLFIVSQVATSPDALEGEGARTLLLFVVSISFVAGLTFDAVYNKLTSQDVVDVSAFRNHLEA